MQWEWRVYDFQEKSFTLTVYGLTLLALWGVGGCLISRKKRPVTFACQKNHQQSQYPCTKCSLLWEISQTKAQFRQHGFTPLFIPRYFTFQSVLFSFRTPEWYSDISRQILREWFQHDKTDREICDQTPSTFVLTIWMSQAKLYR